MVNRSEMFMVLTFDLPRSTSTVSSGRHGIRSSVPERSSLVHFIPETISFFFSFWLRRYKCDHRYDVEKFHKYRTNEKGEPVSIFNRACNFKFY